MCCACCDVDVGVMPLPFSGPPSRMHNARARRTTHTLVRNKICDCRKRGVMPSWRVGIIWSWP